MTDDKWKDLRIEIKTGKVSEEEALKELRTDPTISVLVRIKLGFFPDEFKDFLFIHTTRAGRKVYIHSFAKKDDNMVEMVLERKLGKSFQKAYPYLDSSAEIHTTLPDFLWIVGDGTTALNKIQCDTPIPEGMEGNICDVLPQTVVDDFVHSTNVLNSAILEGAMEHAVLIGPFYKWRNAK